MVLVSHLITTKVWSSTFICRGVLENLRANKQLHTRIEGAQSCADQPIQVMNVASFPAL